MLKSFESHCELEEVRIVCNKLCSLKKRIEKGNFSDPFKEYKDCDNIFDSIKAKAIDIGDESLANAQMIYRHRKGKLYWGDFAIEMIDEIKELQAVCLVSHPEDKRCIIELQEDRDIPEKEKFKKLDEFVKLKINPLQNFKIETKIEQRRDTKIQKANRNDLCPCGSGKKFKRCCINRMYYNHERNIISPLCKVQLIIQDSKNE